MALHQCKASEAPHGKFKQHSRRGSHPVWTCGVNPAQPSGHQQADTTAHTHTHTPTHTRQPYLQSCHFPFPPSPDFHRTCPIGMVVFTSCIGIGGEGVCGVGESGIYTCSHARRQAIIWMACVDDMSLFDGPPCDRWPRPFRIYTHLWSLSFFQDRVQTHGCANQTHPHFGCWWLSSRVWGGNSTQTTFSPSFAFSPGNQRRTRGERQGGPLTTGCHSAAVGMAGPAAKEEWQRGPRLHVPAFPFFHRRDLPFHRDVRRHVHTAETDEIFQIVGHHGVWSRGPGGRVALSSQRST